jgi:ATP-binding cassette subfamily A (ABC1) protein 3
MLRRSTYNPAQSNSKDEDVIHEEEMLKEKSPDDLPVRVAGVTKKFGTIKAVDNVSFGLEYGECFALLGVSGAGKTTCFKSLTGEIMPTSGEVSINGFDVSTKKGFS